MARNKNMRRVTLSGSGAATAPDGYANSGVHIGDVNLLTGTPVRTRYRLQVQRIAPQRLLDRNAELSELGEFCTSPTSDGTYAWWRAKPWSGKSALMSWFVLHPPPGVRIVSFFVTARLASQNDRAAFIDNLMEQLLAMLGEGVPPFLTESTREAHVLGLLADAAAACRGRGENFVLLVDGLDEDRGVHPGLDSHSIAALLPVVLPAGMRVIVSGRPNPPLPADLSPHHPLRNDTIVRTLVPSSQAHAIRDEMERELKRLLHGTAYEQNLLALVTAAGGGLSSSDLAELTHGSKWEVDQHLRTVTGRSFSVREGHFQPGGPGVYVLGHEELQVTARDMLGPARLADYRNRLHAWMDGYRARQWPDDTPEYLLRGYFNMLLAEGEVERMAFVATDPARHVRLLDLSGGDAIALSEITTTLEVIARQESPDLIAMTRLAIHRDRLTHRNSNVPTELPAAWARLGQTNRAEAIADSIAPLSSRAQAVALVAKVLARAGDHRRAADLFDRASAVATTITDPSEQVETLAAVAEAASMAGDQDWAAAILSRADEILPSVSRLLHADALIAVAVARTAMGEFDRAEQIAGSVAPLEYRVEALVTVAEKASEVGDRAAAVNLLDRAHKIAVSIDDLLSRSHAVVALAKAASAAGDHEKATDIVDRVEAEVIRSVDHPFQRAAALVALAEAADAAGDQDKATRILDRAEKTARRTGHHHAIALVVKAVAEIRDFDRAERLASVVIDLERSAGREPMWVTAALMEATGKSGDFDRALAMAPTITNPIALADALSNVAEAAAEAGYLDYAEGIASSITELRFAAETLISVATRIAETEDYGRAAILLERAALIVRVVTDSHKNVEALVALAEAAGLAGDRERAVTLVERATETADAIADPDENEEMLAMVAVVAGRIGVFDRAEELAEALISPRDNASALVAIAQAATAAGYGGRAIRLLTQVENSIETSAHFGHNAKTLALVAAVAGATGDRERAVELLDRATAFGSAIADPIDQDLALVEIVRAACAIGDFDRAEEITQTIDDGSLRVAALAATAALLEDRARATLVLDRAENIAGLVPGQYQQDEAYAAVSEAAASVGDMTRAERISNLISDPHVRAQAILVMSHSCTSLQRENAIAQVLTLDAWYAPLRELIKFVPDAIGIVLNELTISEFAERP